MSERSNSHDNSYGAVPDALRERDNWVCYRLEPYTTDDGEEKTDKIPVNPRTGANASSADPDTWADFETAVEAAASRDGVDGIGLMLRNGDTLAGVDFDDVRHVDPETGAVTVSAWAGEAIRALDSYTEVSPSGTGFHVWVFGFKPGDSSKTEVENGEDIEMYDHGDNRFLTVTGDRVPEPSPDVEQRNDVFGDLYREYFEIEDDGDGGDSAAVATTSEPAGDIDLSDEALLEKARNATNGAKFCALEAGSDSMHGGDTSRADKALCQHLAFWTGGDRERMDRLFRQSNRLRGKWDDVHSGDGDTYGEMTIDAALDDQTEFYNPEYGTPRRAEADGGTAAAPASSDGSDDAGGLPAPHEFNERGGEYGTLRTVGSGDDERQVWDRWTSFRIEVVEFLAATDAGTGEADLRATLRIHPSADREPAYEVVVPMTVFNEPRKFRDAVCTRKTCTFDAGLNELNKIRRYVGAQRAPDRLGVKQLGLYGVDDGSDDGTTEWVTPKGAITADGWADDPRHVYDGRDTALASAWALDPDDGDEYDTDTVASILELLPRTRLSERLLPALGWFYAAPLRPYLMDWDGEFNHLNVLGDTGSGKTTTLGVLNQLFGGGREPLSATASSFSVMSSFASSNAMPVVFDEYKPTDMADYEVKRFGEYYRKATRGAIETRGTKTLDQTLFPLRAPVAVAGEQSIKGAAERRRTILTTFSARSTANYSDTKQAFAKLTGTTYEAADGEIRHFDGLDLHAHALAYYRFVTGLDRETVRAMWNDAEENARALLSDLPGDVADEFDDAERRGLQTIWFGCELFRRFAAEHGVEDAEHGVDTEAIEDAMRYSAVDADAREKSRGGRSSHVDQFLGLMSSAALAGYLEEGTHYGFVHEGKADELLGFRLNETFAGVRRYVKDHDLQGEDVLNAASDYRARLRDAAETPESVVEATSAPVPGLNRAVRIRVGRAMETVEGFDRDLFSGDERAPNKHVGFGVDPDALSEGHAAADAKAAAADASEDDGDGDAANGDGDRDGGDPKPAPDELTYSQDERVKKVRQALETLADRTGSGEGVARDEIADYLAENYGIGPDDTHRHLNQFLRDGDAFETAEDRLLPLW